MGKIAQVVDAVKKVIKKPNYNDFDMSSKESRESVVERDFYYAKSHRSGQVTKWQKLDDYYNNEHYTKEQIKDLCAKNNWNFVPPVLTDPFIQVESQIDSEVPEPEFIGRDDDQDNLKAKERQQVVECIVYNNKLKQLNTENERNLNKFGNAFWKVAFDGSIKGFGFQGDIVIGNPALGNIFPDPSAYDVQDCEYIIYCYRMHRRKARRIYGSAIDEIKSNGFIKDTEIFDREDSDINQLDDTVQVLEYWYKDEEGDVACSIQVDFNEVKFIPKYWVNTRASGNQLYPFVKYCKIPVDQSFWDKGEIETIVDLVDAGDRELISALLVDMMQPSDVIVYEPNALADGETIETGPNAVIKMKDGKAQTGIKRLGGLGSNINALNMINFLHNKIEETTGNSVSNNGVEPTKVTTASGIAMLNERADARKSIKKADRLSGFERLYELIDWSALEFYNTDRVIQIRGQEATKDGVFNNGEALNQDQKKKSFVFNSDNHKVPDKNKALELTKQGIEDGKSDEEIEQIVEENAYYYPPVDCQIVAGEGISKSLSFVLQMLEQLIKANITPINLTMVESMIDLLDIPEKKDIKAALEQALKPQLTPGTETNQANNQLTPEELQTFLKATPEQQAEILHQLGLTVDDIRNQIQGGQSNVQGTSGVQEGSE